MVETRRGSSVTGRSTARGRATLGSTAPQGVDSPDSHDQQVMSPRLHDDLEDSDGGDREDISRSVDRQLQRTLHDRLEDEAASERSSRRLSRGATERQSSRASHGSSSRGSTPLLHPVTRLGPLEGHAAPHGGSGLSTAMPDFSKITKLKGQEDFEDWQREMLAVFRMCGFDLILSGELTLADLETPAERTWWKIGLAKVIGALTLSMEREIQRNYDDYFKRSDAVGLWRALIADFAQRRPTNPVTIFGELYNRRLRSDETAAAYIKDLERLQLELRRTDATLSDEWLTRIMLTNVIDVFEDVSREHTQAQARGAKLCTLSEAKNLLLARDGLDTSHGKRGDVGVGGDKSALRANQSGGIFAVQSGRGNGGENSKKRHQSHDHGNNRKFKKRRPHCGKCGKHGHKSHDCKAPSKSAGDESVGRDARDAAKPPRDSRSFLNAIVCAVHKDRPDSDTITWCLDSGAEVNLCYDRSAFEYLEETEPHTLFMANGSEATVTKMGGVAMFVRNETTGAVEERLLEHVYFAPDVNVNIIAMDYLQSAGFAISFPAGAHSCVATKRDLCLRFDKVNRLYRLTATKKLFDRTIVAAVETVAAVPPAKDDSDDDGSAEREAALMHQRYCHASSGTLVKMAVQKVVKGLKLKKGKMTDYECVPCILAKSKRMSYNTKPRRATVPLEKLCIDLSAMGETAIDGSTQVLLVVDEATRYRWGFLLVHKNDAKIVLGALIKRLNNKFKRRGFSVKTLHADGGGEFIDFDLADLCAEFGIEQTFTNPYSPEENSIVERANGIMAVKVRALLHMTGLPTMLWGAAYLHAIVTVNVTSSKALKGRTPHEALYDEIPDVSFLRTWGCLVFATIQEASRERKEKLEHRSEPALLVGYSPNTKGYLLLAVPSCKILKHRAGNLKFMEQFTLKFEYAEKMLLNAYFYGDHEVPDMPEVTPIKTTVASLAAPPPLPPLPRRDELVRTRDSVGDSDGNVGSADLVGASDGHVASADSVGAAMDSGGCAASAVTKPLATNGFGSASARKRSRDAPATVTSGRSRRKRRPSTRLKDFVPSDDRAAVFAALSKVAKSVPVDPLQLPKAHEIPIPNSQKDAARSAYATYWQAAEDDELASLRLHGTWHEIPRRSVPRSHRVISCRWVYTAKADANGNVARFKARLVIHGFRQRHGVDFDETYAPVVRFDSIRAILYYAVRRGWQVLQFDVKTAFLHGDLEEQVFMELPPGRRGDGTMVCRLVKSLYGLKQAPRVWNQTLHRALVDAGYRRLDADSGLYTRQVGEDIVSMVSVYVDDLLVMGADNVMRDVVTALRRQFELTDLGPVRFLLGIEICINRRERTIFMSQGAYTSKILQRFHMDQCHGVATPESKTESQVQPKSGTEMPYREIVGAVQYLVSGTRPDIAHATRYLGQFNDKFTWVEFMKAKRLLRYLQFTRDYGLLMRVPATDMAVVETFADADFANDVTDRKSITGYVSQIDGNTVTYASKKQGITALSTSEAEYVAMHDGARDIVWLCRLLDEIKLKYVKPPTLWNDNKSTVYLTERPGKHAKFKHVDPKYHYTRDLVELKKIQTKHCSTNDMPADILTKGLERVKFERFRSMLGVVKKEVWMDGS